VRANVYYDAQGDGLEQSWCGRVWMNPPYGRTCPLFIAKLLAEHDAGKVDAAIALVNAYSTDSRWFQPLWDHTLCFTNHRIDFTSPGGSEPNSTNGSVFVYLGPDRSRFAQVFRQFGRVVVAYEELRAFEQETLFETPQNRVLSAPRAARKAEAGR
jgi:hypothetical protein